MRVFMLFALAAAATLAAQAADAAAAVPCVRGSNPNEYNVHAIGPHDLWIANSVGDRRPIRAATTCIHIRPESIVNVHADFHCIAMGDEVGIGNLGMPGEQCRITKVTAFKAGSEAKGYR